MQRYGVRDVEKLLRLPRSTIRSMITAGFVKPTRGTRNEWLFSFQDLIVLRTAQALVAANVPGRRITRAVKELRRQVPEHVRVEFEVRPASFGVEGGREPLAGGLRPVSPRLRGRSRERIAQRDRAKRPAAGR